MEGNNMDEQTTIPSILNWFTEAIKNRQPIRPDLYLDAASKLLILSQDLDEQLAEYETKMAEREMELIEKGETVARSKSLKRRAVDFRMYLMTKALKERVVEFIRLSKKRVEVFEY